VIASATDLLAPRGDGEVNQVIRGLEDQRRRQQEAAEDAAALLARMQQPLLVLWGEADRLVPIEVSRQLVRYKSDLELTLLEGVGHCPHDEAPAEFSQQLHPWLSRLKAAT